MSATTKVKDKDKKRIGPTDPKIDALARDRIVSARIGLLLGNPFFGTLATQLKLENADSWCGTAATCGKKLYYNSRFIMELKNKEVQFLVAHEILHVCYDHLGRVGKRDRNLFNIANDYAVNADLKRHKVGDFIKSVPCLYEQKYDGMTSEAIYDDLYQNAQKIDLDTLIDQLIDEHLESEGEGDSDGDTDDNGKPKSGSGKPKLNDKELEELKKELRSQIINAAKNAKPGQVPANIERMIKEITNPVMPWRELLQTNITSLIKSDYSWMRPSRRSWHMDAVLPALKPGDEVDVTVMIDLSGSISENQARDFISEVVGMTNAFEGWRVNIATFDTEVYNYQSFTSDNQDDITEYQLKGGGGTDFVCMFNYLKEHGHEPKRLIVFTDGYPFGSWGDPDYCDTTWIIHGSTDITPPFGQHAYYDDHKQSAS